MTRSGWTAGAGVEYNYYDSSGALLTGPVNTLSINSLKDTIHAVTAGLNYRF